MSTNLPSQQLYSPTDSITFSDSAKDSYFPTEYQQAETGPRDDLLHHLAYFGQPRTEEDFQRSSPYKTAVDTSGFIEPSVLDWNGQPSDCVPPPAYQLGCNVSLPSARSDTPELCEDGECFPGNDSLPQTPADEFAPLSFHKQTSADQQPGQPAKRKRGRPRIVRAESESGEAKPNSRASKRLPHNQVERKYREGLNAELERLRSAVPTLPQRDANAMNGPPKPSKATVLASAIDYIHQMERERDILRQENEALRTGKRLPGLAKANSNFRDCSRE